MRKKNTLAHWRTTAPKHVLFVSRHCCTRVQKQAVALRALGWRVDSLSSVPPSNNTGFEQGVIAEEHKFKHFIGESGASIVHVHNEPDSLMRYASDAANGRPIVYDCHDLEYYRHGHVTDDERFAFRRADAIVHVSQEHRDIAYSLHPWKCPDVIVMSCPPRAWIPDDPGHERSGVVYEGGVAAPGSEVFNWRDLSGVESTFRDAGIDFHIYSSGNAARQYEGYKGWLDYRKLLRTMQRYKYGFLGTEQPVEKWKVAVPNKLWDYAASGVIPIICNAPAAAVAFGKGAIVCTSVDDAIAQMSKRRPRMTPRFMDDEIPALVALYGRLS